MSDLETEISAVTAELDRAQRDRSIAFALVRAPLMKRLIEVSRRARAESNAANRDACLERAREAMWSAAGMSEEVAISHLQHLSPARRREMARELDAISDDHERG